MSGAKFGDVFSTTGKVLISLFLIFIGVSVVYFTVAAITTTTASANGYLFAAYAATWIIHIVYLSTLASRYARLQREIEELKKK